MSQKANRERVSSRRPGHLTAANDVKMQVKNALAAVGAGVDDAAVAVAGDALGLSDLPGGQQQATEHGFVGWLGVVEPDDFLARNHQYMDGRHGVHVVEGVDEVVFIDGDGGDFAAEDFGKNGHGESRG